jgi:hypothetical protein
MATILLTTEKKKEEKDKEQEEVKATWRIPDWLLVEYKHWAIDARTSVNTIVVDALTAYYNAKRKGAKR